MSKCCDAPKAALFVVCALFGLLGRTNACQAGTIFDYNVIVTDTFTAASHVQGTTFANQLIAVNNPDFAQSPAAGTGDTLTVAGAISGSPSVLERGVYRYAQAAAPAAILNGGSSLVHDPTVSITGLATQMSAASSFYASLSSSHASPVGNTLTLTASGSGATVFNESASDLMGANLNITLTAVADQSIIVLVPDAGFTFGSSEHVSLGGGTTATQILWVFPNATSISMNDSQWFGSTLAPIASLTDNNQNMNGGVYVKNFNQTAEVHLSDPNLGPGQPQFNGPSVPEPATAVLILLGGIGLVRFVRRRGLSS
ncbi:MAG TPA: collagen-binding domain-containing protein [Pirellulales bacterium]